MRLAFMGTPDFAVPALRALVDAGHEIAAVYTQPPRPAGRGKRPRPSPVHAAGATMGLDVRTPATLRDPAAQADFAALGLEAAVVVAYGLILPRPILEAPKHGCINIHASLLPRWRGAAPIQRAIMNGDTETGISIMKMDEGLDTGPVIAARAVPIGRHDTAADLHDRLAGLGAEMIVEVLADPAGWRLQPQDDAAATYAPKIDKAEARIDWALPAARIDRQIRALSPFPGAWTTLDGARLKLLLSEPAEGAGPPGEVIGPGLVVACGEGAVRILKLQRAGRAAMGAEEFLRGTGDLVGRRLGKEKAE